jgi:tetratricopeptide (TPR) repeat protein
MVRRLRPAALAAGLLFSSILSCATTVAVTTTVAGDRGDDLLVQASDRYLSGDIRAAHDLFRRAAWALATSSRRADAWYWQGRCELSLGRLAEARRSFDAARNASRDVMPGRVQLDTRRDLEARILVGLVDVTRMQSKHAESLSYIQQLESEGLASRVDAGEFAYRKAVALEALKRTDLARRHDLRAARQLRTSPLSTEARRRASQLARSRYLATAGVYTARSSAESVAHELQSKGVEAMVERFDAESRFAVALGSYERYEDAREAAAKASAHGFPASVTPHQPGRKSAAP